jgi:hypothetical protein
MDEHEMNVLLHSQPAFAEACIAAQNSKNRARIL